ncbi:MAG: glycosyltransferase family 4 protein [Acidiferrobacterales bacterium]
MEKKKIIFLNRYFYPDQSTASQLLTDLAFHLAAQDQIVYVITSRQRYDDANAHLDARTITRGVNIHRVWTSSFGRANLLGRTFDYFSFYLSASWTLFRMAHKGDLVVAKTDPPLISICAAYICKLRRAQLINWLQNLFPEVASALGMKGFTGKRDNFIKKMRNNSLRQARKNVVLGDSMKKVLWANRINPSKIKVIHNWADEKAIKPVEPDDNYLRRTWGLNKKFVVGYSGNMGRAHDLEIIMSAAEKLKDNKQIHFLFIGGGIQLKKLQLFVVDKMLENVMFQPYQERDQLAESLSVADVHLVSLKPSLEGLIVPSKFYGIIAVGRPAIYLGDQIGEIASIIQEASCGYALDSNDVDGLVESISGLAGDPELCRGMGIEARKLFDERFTKSRALAEWTQLLTG